MNIPDVEKKGSPLLYSTLYPGAFSNPTVLYRALLRVITVSPRRFGEFQNYDSQSNIRVAPPAYCWAVQTRVCVASFLFCVYA